MPVYSFRCKDCNNTKTEFVHRHQDLVVPKCNKCNNKMVRDFKADMFRTHADSYARPIHSDSLAISPEQRKEHEQKFPYIKLDSQCRPVFDNYKDHKKYLDANGYIKVQKKKKVTATKKIV